MPEQDREGNVNAADVKSTPIKTSNKNRTWIRTLYSLVSDDLMDEQEGPETYLHGRNNTEATAASRRGQHRVADGVL
uniref:Uncharacterized protein n=1 Tax=Nothobranchius korthausae TaxID=1143690 RepID=A0A1A8EZY2_9TELE